MAVKLHRCSNQWVKIKAHPCWRVEKALMDSGVEFVAVDNPHATRLTLHILAAVAEHERAMIAERSENVRKFAGLCCRIAHAIGGEQGEL